MPPIDNDTGKKAAAQHAAKLVKDGMIVGLGTGSTAKFFIEALGDLIKKGLHIRAVSSSERSQKLALQYNIPVVDINTLESLDITVDGADEIDRNLQMIKGGGGALLREKIVASMSSQVVAIVDSSKVVEHLGKFKLPVEVLPFAHPATMASLQKHGFDAALRIGPDGTPYVTDNGNFIADIKLQYPCKDPAKENDKLKQIPGVLETGFFLNIATVAYVGFPDGHVEILKK